jgi:hypothetical protein
MGKGIAAFMKKLTLGVVRFSASVRRRLRGSTTAGISLLVAGLSGAAAEPPKAPVPNSPYIGVVYRFADTMLERGRDNYGPKKTGLFLSALDRATLAPLTNRPAAPSGIREGDRVGLKSAPLAGANLQHDENLLRLLYTLSELSGKPKYREAADAELRWVLENAASPATRASPWGERLSWDVMNDGFIAAEGGGTHEFFRPWLLWDRCFALAPADSTKLARDLWEHQFAGQRKGAFDQLAGLSKTGPQGGMEFPRHAGFYIRTWAVAYSHHPEAQFLTAIQALLERHEKKRQSRTGLIEAHAGNAHASPASTLSLAIDCDGAAHRVPEPFATRLRVFAAREDEIFCSLPHDLKNRKGFVSAVSRATGKSSGPDTPLWEARYDRNTTAQVALMCVSRYDNTGKVGYRKLIAAAADAYRDTLPGDGVDVWPLVIGQVISLELAAWRHTARPVYLESARKFADLAVEKLFQNNPLPRASTKSDHYEAITGADTLALALIELHLNILYITAVQCPPNTIDR